MLLGGRSQHPTQSHSRPLDCQKMFEDLRSRNGFAADIKVNAADRTTP
jgi:hypothetical protein